MSQRVGPLTALLEDRGLRPSPNTQMSLNLRSQPAQGYRTLSFFLNPYPRRSLEHVHRNSASFESIEAPLLFESALIGSSHHEHPSRGIEQPQCIADLRANHAVHQ